MYNIEKENITSTCLNSTVFIMFKLLIYKIKKELAPIKLLIILNV